MGAFTCITVQGPGLPGSFPCLLLSQMIPHLKKKIHFYFLLGKEISVCGEVEPVGISHLWLSSELGVQSPPDCSGKREYKISTTLKEMPALCIAHLVLVSLWIVDSTIKDGDILTLRCAFWKPRGVGPHWQKSPLKCVVNDGSKIWARLKFMHPESSKML